VERNFTAAEIEYCKSQPDSHASFAGRWAAKEAVIKAVSSYNLARDAGWKGAGAGLKEIEILPSASKAPSVTLHGEAKSLVQKAGIREIKVSISHSGDYAVATAHAC
jgi:fatty acid synthase subunit beta